MPERLRLTRRLGLTTMLAALASACAPLTLFATLAPQDHVRRPAAAIAYGPQPHQRLDVYAPRRDPAAAPRPLAVFFFGGSWDTGRRQDYGWVGKALAAQGYVTVIPDYGLYPATQYPGFLRDGALAIRWAQDHAGDYGADPTRIVIVGHSAGAYNAAMIALDPTYLRDAGVEPHHIRALVGLSGPYDFLPLNDPIARRTFGAAADPVATQPLTYARSDAPPAFLATGDRDTMVFPRNTTRLAAALRARGATVEEHHYPTLDHAGTVLALSRPLRGRTSLLGDMTAFLEKQVGPQ